MKNKILAIFFVSILSIFVFSSSSFASEDSGFNVFGHRLSNGKDFVFSLNDQKNSFSYNRTYKPFNIHKYFKRAVCSYWNIKDNNNYDSSSSRKEFFEKACDSLDGKYKSFSYFSFDSDNSYKNYHYYFYTGEKSDHINFTYMNNYINGYSFSKAFAYKVDSSDFKNWNYITVSSYRNTLPNYSESDYELSLGYVSARSHNFSDLYSHYKKDQYIFSQAEYLSNNRIINHHNDFNVSYPSDYPESYKMRNSSEFSRPSYVPYIYYSVSDKQIIGAIVAYDSSGLGFSEQHNFIPNIEIYNSDKTQKIHGFTSNYLADEFTFSFPDYGDYYIKSFVSPRPPFNGSVKYEIKQPVWTKIVINGGSYSFINSQDSSGSSYCSGLECNSPSYANSCTAIHDSFASAMSCEYNKLLVYFKKKISFLLFPISAFNRISHNFSTYSTVSCSVKVDKLPIDVCWISRDYPNFYYSATAIFNGSILFMFSVFCYHEMRKFFGGGLE